MKLRIGEESGGGGDSIGPNEGRLGAEGRQVGPDREVLVDHGLVGEARIIILVVHFWSVLCLGMARQGRLDCVIL